METKGELRLRPAVERDIPEIMAMIRALASHLGMEGQVIATEETLRNALFDTHPDAEVVMACLGDETVGFALFFQTYSTFRGRCGLHLEDLYVRPEYRGHNVGKKLLAHLARITIERECGRLEWSALGSDEAAISFYEGIGATAKDEWTMYRLRGEALRQLAGA